MTIQNQTSGPGTAKAPEGQRSDDDKGSPPGLERGEAAAETQDGQPGLPSTEEKDWSPGSDQEKSRI